MNKSASTAKSLLPLPIPRFVRFEATRIRDRILKRISQQILALSKNSIPHFVHFYDVEINYGNFVDKRTFLEECALFQPLFRLLRQNNLVGTDATMNLYCENRIRKVSHSTFIDHIFKELLPNFIHYKSFEFAISLRTPATNLIASLLNAQPICHSSNIIIGDSFRPTELPVKIIGDWLDRPIKKGQKPTKPNVLRLRIDLILNPLEMVNHLKEVIFK